MRDGFGREICYMRISITDRCNYRCLYCMPEQGIESLDHNDILSYDEIIEIVKAGILLGIYKYRLTGGEPLVRKDTVGLVRELRNLPGVHDLSMTTNGSLLTEYAHDLKSAGLDRVNISLDTLKPHKFNQITRRGHLKDVLNGVAAAQEAGLQPIKINVVLSRDFNDDEIVNFIGLTRRNPYEVRFIERMPIGEIAGEEDEAYISSDDVIEQLLLQEETATMEQLPTGDIAKYYRLPGAKGKFGFITPMSNCFCPRCNRIRLTSDGKIKTCLHSNREIDTKPFIKDGEKLRDCLAQAILAKEEKHLLLENGQFVHKKMNKIGG